jgi:hypothetical protein
MSIGAFADEHHGFYWIPAESDVAGFRGDDVKVPKSLNPWFTPELIMPMIEDGTMAISNIYKDSNTDMIARQTKLLTGGQYCNSVTGAVMSYNFDNGYMEVTVPSQLTNPTDNPSTFSGTDGVALFHLVLGSSPSRINDSGNTLSYNGKEAYLYDCNGVYVGIKAPAGCSVKAYLSTPSMSADNLNGFDDFSGYMHTAAFDCGTLTSDDYVELTSGEPYNNLACIKYTSDYNSKWPYGYCAKFVDVAVYGVKVGDKIGFGGLQTLHPGWTPVPFYTPSGIAEISADVDANAPVEYFNIQGVKVAADNLTPGLYITRQGSKATKVLVK